jgi:hypothetical protein
MAIDYTPAGGQREPTNTPLSFPKKRRLFRAEIKKSEIRLFALDDPEDVLLAASLKRTFKQYIFPTVPIKVTLNPRSSLKGKHNPKYDRYTALKVESEAVEAAHTAD